MAVEQQSQPLDVSCIDLDALREQRERLGYVIVSTARPLTDARRAILGTIVPDHLVRLEAPSKKFSLDIPVVTDDFSRQLIAAARDEAKLSFCMWRQVGCVLADPETQQIVERTHNGPVGNKRFCRDLGVSYRELEPLLGKNERLEACHARHAENAMAARIIEKQIDPKGYFIGVDVDPCDHCANFLAGVHPEAVLVDFNPSREYYNALGLRILQDAGIPTLFVRMPGE